MCIFWGPGGHNFTPQKHPQTDGKNTIGPLGNPGWRAGVTRGSPATKKSEKLQKIGKFRTFCVFPVCLGVPRGVKFDKIEGPEIAHFYPRGHPQTDGKNTI